MIKKLFRTKKSLPMPAPVSPYKDLPEFLGQGEPFTEWDRHTESSAFFVNIPGKNENELGTIKIMFAGRDGFYDLENNKFSTLPEGWEEIFYKYGGGGTAGPLKFRYDYGGPWDFSSFPADKYMQMLCSNCGIKNAEKKFSQLLCKLIWNDFCDFQDSHSHAPSYPPHQSWKRFERKSQKEYQKVTKLAAYYAEKYKTTGKPQHCPYLPKYETFVEGAIKILQKYDF